MSRGVQFAGLIRRTATLGLVLAVLDPLLAATNEVAAVRIETPSVVYSFFRLTGALVMVIALFLAGVWLLRNWQRVTVNRGRLPKLNVLEVKSLGSRHALYVIGYEQQRFLLSSAPAGISMLTSLPAAPEPASESPAVAPALNFADSLARVLSAKAGKPGGAS